MGTYRRVGRQFFLDFSWSRCRSERNGKCSVSPIFGFFALNRNRVAMTEPRASEPESGRETER